MSKYKCFEDFVRLMIDKACKQHQYRYSKHLTDAFDVSVRNMITTSVLISNRWCKYLAAIVLLLIGPIAFVLASVNSS